MKIWLLALAIASGLFVAGSALLAPPPDHWQASLPDAVSLTSINAQGATLTQTIHKRSTIQRLVTDLDRLSPLADTGAACSSAAGGYRAVLGYPDGGRTTLTADKSGCQRIVISGKGRSAGRSWTDPILLRDFDALFPPSWQTGV